MIFNMSLQTIISIASLAIAIGGLVPVFMLYGRGKAAVVLVITITALVLLSAMGVYQAIHHQNEISYISGKVMEALSEEGPSTIDQLEQSIHHGNFPDILESVEKMVRTGKIQYEIIELHDTQQNTYFVGIYMVPTSR
jgi:hypothetical protein